MLPHLAQCDGLSISGGEPFEQPDQVASLVDVLREKLDVSVLAYTGFRLERLRRQPAAKALLGRIDMLMDGPFVEGLPTEKPWRGSDNQRLHLLSERARQTVMEETDWRQIQLQPLADGSVRLIGIPKRGDLERLRIALSGKGLRLRSEV